jgi:hypothetical protein
MSPDPSNTRNPLIRPSRKLPRSLLLAGVVCAALLLATLALFLADERTTAVAAADYRVTTIGGIEYEAMSGRPINPASSVDRAIIAGLPARDRLLHHGQMLFGAFVAFTNASTRPLRSADRIELRDDGGHLYEALPLPATNPYAYSPRSVGPQTRIPAEGSPADNNLAATGRLVLFRIPASAYTNGGTLELVIHDPLHPDQMASLII